MISFIQLFEEYGPIKEHPFTSDSIYTVYIHMYFAILTHHNFNYNVIEEMQIEYHMTLHKYNMETVFGGIRHTLSQWNQIGTVIQIIEKQYKTPIAVTPFYEKL